MRILLDTHIFIWWDLFPHLLSPSARNSLSDPRNSLVLSVVSAWEMQIKLSIGKLQLRLPLDELIEEQQRNNHIEILPVVLPHVLALDALPMHHKDPFDRLLIAQAQVEGLPILSADAIFSAYPLTVLR